MIYLLAVRGIGEGCDYTIGCNQKIVTIEANDLDHAQTLAEEFFYENGGLELIESISICTEVSSLDIRKIQDEALRRASEKMVKAQQARDLAELKRLKALYEKEPTP